MPGWHAAECRQIRRVEIQPSHPPSSSSICQTDMYSSRELLNVTDVHCQSVCYMHLLLFFAHCWCRGLPVLVDLLNTRSEHRSYTKNREIVWNALDSVWSVFQLQVVLSGRNTIDAHRRHQHPKTIFAACLQSATCSSTLRPC